MASDGLDSGSVRARPGAPIRGGIVTVHAHCEERIRLLREAMMSLHTIPFDRRHLAIREALASDDALAATPPPDLPLRELAALEWLIENGFDVLPREGGGALVCDDKPYPPVWSYDSWYEAAHELGWDGTVPGG